MFITASARADAAHHLLALQPFLGVLCFFVTFFLIGVWHGRTSEFIIFGVLQGGGVAINKLWQMWLTGPGPQEIQGAGQEPIYIAFGRGLTFIWFAFTLFWFWGTGSRSTQSSLRCVTGHGSRFGWRYGYLPRWYLALWEWLRAVLFRLRPLKARCSRAAMRVSFMPLPSA